VTVDLITTDMIARDGKSAQFIADLKPEEIEIYEDGVKQKIASIELIHGGRAYNVVAPPPAPVQEGIILPRNKPTNDTAGRVFIIFIDDLHLDFRQTPRTRWLIQHTLDTLAREGDVWSVVSTGASNLELAPTTDLTAVRAAIRRVTGNALGGRETSAAADAERRRRAAVAQQMTAEAIARVAAELTSGTLTVLYVSGGYHTRVVQPMPAVIEAARRVEARVIPIWPYDGAPAGEPPDEWEAYVTATQDRLRTLAAETGGQAVITPADFNPNLRPPEPAR
jgi:VWFA-related protein